ncbi:MAG TPA: MDR family oxidoreductase [Ilumatobacteraceae bacterium]|nr:MDR family oxidoreductase [Ilumatobacteraceae bacterium]
MSDTFTALVLRETADGHAGALEQLTDADLPDGDVTVEVSYSSLNYKDGLALAGRNRIVRSYPMVPGIDLTGTVIASSSPEWSVGDEVIATSFMLGERYWGGFTQRQRVRSEWLVRRPESMAARRAMAIGTAGLTAMLCVMELESAGVRPADGPIVVTGAAGGVGSMAVAMLAGLGYEVTAVTGRPETHEYLRQLGASAFLTREEMSEPPRPLESETWAGAIDTVGSTMLAKVLAQMKFRSTVTACGLVGGADLPTTVMPFIIRAVRLQGVEAVLAPIEMRRRAWDRLAKDLPAELIDAMTEVVPLTELLDRGPTILDGQVRGRWVVDTNA